MTLKRFIAMDVFGAVSKAQPARSHTPVAAPSGPVIIENIQTDRGRWVCSFAIFRDLRHKLLNAHFSGCSDPFERFPKLRLQADAGFRSIDDHRSFRDLGFSHDALGPRRGV
jgi:hypothetical protein